MTFKSDVRSSVFSVCIFVLAAIMVIGSCSFSEAVNVTMSGVISARAVDDTSIILSMYYTGDDNGNNTCTVQYKPCTEDTYTPWITNSPHTSSPYKTTITGLAANTCYDIRTTYNDTDNVGGAVTRTFRIISTWDNTLLHNVNRFSGSGKWAAEGGWGLPGTKYGKINCETCHTPRAANIKGISGNISAPNSADQFPGQTGGLGIDFKSLTTPNGFGDDTGGHTEAGKICEYCHSRTTYHRYNTTGQTSLTHNNNTNCLQCHPHAEGFYYVTGACDSCHGNPPVLDSVGGPEGLASAPPTGSLRAGAHSAHTAKSVACSSCHYISDGTGPTHRDGSVTLGFYAFGGSYQGGAYDGQTTVSSYNAVATTPATTTSKTGAKTCSNIYCHGATMAPNGGSNTTSTWDSPVTGACGTCHGATAADPPTRGSHEKHAGSGSIGMELECTTCHLGYEPDHINGRVDWSIDTATKSWLAGAQYKGTVSGSGTPVPSASYGQCTNVYCHSNVQANGGNGPTAYATPTWGAASAGACGTCHGADTGATQIMTGSHAKHVADNNYPCGNCHNAAGTGTAKHADHNIDVAFNSINPAGVYSQSGSNPPGNGYGSCSSAYCHGQGTLQWGAASLACNGCHDATNAGGLSTRHDRHFNRATAPGSLAEPNAHTASAYVYGCNNCHPGTSHAQGPVSGVQDAQINGSKLSAGNYTAAGTNLLDTRGFKYTNYGTCSSVCHTRDGVSGAPVVAASWGGAYTGDCGVCHNKAGDLSPVWSSPHTKHINIYGSNANITCNSCHSVTATNNSAINGASGRNQHPNANKDVAMNTWVGGTVSGAQGAQQCQNTYCHSQGTALTGAYSHAAIPWSGTFDCAGCHTGGTTTGPSYTNGSPKKNSHSAHVVYSAYSCDKCHYGTTTNGTTISNAANHVNKAYDVNPNTVAGITFTYNYSVSGGTCSAISCHGNIEAQWGSILVCANCHGNMTVYPDMGQDQGIITCTDCHTGHTKTSAFASCLTCHQGSGYTGEEMQHNRPIPNFVGTCDAATSNKINFSAASTVCLSGYTCSYSWDFGQAGGTTTDANTSTPTHTYTSGGTYPVTLTVTAAAAVPLRASVTKSVPTCTVNQAPTCGRDAGSLSFLPSGGRTVSFGDNSWDDNPATATVSVAWGDSSTTTYALNANPSHTYASNGAYVIRQSVQDATGMISQCDPLTVTFPTEFSVTVNMSKPATYATVKVLLDGATKSQGTTGAAGLTWTSVSLPANADYTLSVFKTGATFSCNGAIVDLSTGNQTVSCTVTP